MGIYKNLDITVSASGDLTVGSNGDFLLTNPAGVLKQDIAFRLRTDPGEFVPHQALGAGLSELIGEPNSRENTRKGESKIIQSLTNDAMIGRIDLSVRGVPIALDRVVYYVFVNGTAGQMNVTPEVVFSITNGLTNIPGA
jgi:hypothetical protein